MLERDIILEGRRVRLEPIAEDHLQGIAAAGNDPALWEFTYHHNPFVTDEDARRWFDAAQPSASLLTFAVRDRPTGRIVGSTRFADLDPQNRKLEIRHTFFAREMWRSGANVECKFLMLRHAFERWNALRVQFKANGNNERSRRALQRIGATFEGELRNFRIRPKTGEYNSVAIFSIIASEWPDVRGRLEARLAG